MLIYTRATLDKIVTDIKRFSRFFSIATLAFSIGYMIYAMACGVGVLWVNICLTAISVAYMVIYIMTVEKKDRMSKDVKRYSTHAFKCTKIVLKAYTVGLAIYGIYIASEKADTIAIILAMVNLCVWGLQVMLELVSLVVERYKELLIASIQADVEQITKPVKTVIDTVKVFTGREPTPSQVPLSKRKILEDIVIGFKNKKAKQKAEKKAEKAVMSDNGKAKETAENGQNMAIK